MRYISGALGLLAVGLLCILTTPILAMESQFMLIEEPDSNDEEELQGDRDDDKEKKMKASDVPPSSGYVYMNVLGPYYDDTIKISQRYVVLKVGKASKTTLNTRMRTEWNAASALNLKASWPMSATEDKTGLKAYKVYLRSFNPDRARDALPYYMVPVPQGDVTPEKELANAEKEIRKLWGESVLRDPESLAWFALRSGRNGVEACRGDAGKLGAITETVVVPWSIITHVRQAGRDAGPDKWNMKALSDAIAAAKGAGGPLTAMKEEWTAMNDAQVSLLPVIKNHANVYLDGIMGLKDLTQEDANHIKTFIALQERSFALRLDTLHTLKKPKAEPMQIELAPKQSEQQKKMRQTTLEESFAKSAKAKK